MFSVLGMIRVGSGAYVPDVKQEFEARESREIAGGGPVGR